MQTERQDRGIFSRAQMLAWVDAQTRLGPRRAGSPAAQALRAHLEAELIRIGLDRVRQEKVIDPLLLPEQAEATGDVASRPDPERPVTWWNPTSEDIELVVKSGASQRSFAAFPVPFAAFTGPAGIEGRLAYADPLERYGDAVAAWQDRIVVTPIRFPPLPPEKLLGLALDHFDPHHNLTELDHPATWIRLGWEHYDRAVKSGARGFIGILVDQPGGDHQMYAPYGFKERDILNKPIPALWVGQSTEAALTQAARQEGATARFKTLGSLVASEDFNVIGEIPGLSDEVIIVTSHFDAPFVSPVEDASGVAVVLALAEHFAEVAKATPLRRGLVFVLTAGHFYGSVGTRSFIASHPELVERGDRARPRAVCEVTIEHVAREAVLAANGQGLEPRRDAAHPLGRPEPAAIFMSYNKALRGIVGAAMREHALDRTVLFGASGPLGQFPPSDGGDWYLHGIPTINYISNPVYLLNRSGDEVDATGDFTWLASERLPQVAAAFARVIREIDQTPTAALFASDMPVAWAKNQIARWIAHRKTGRS